MNRRTSYLIVGLILMLLSIWFYPNSREKNEEFSEIAKISLRNVGHQLLLLDQDSTSLVLPIIELGKSKFRLSFQNQLAFEPRNLVDIVQSSLKKASLPNNYRVEVIQCANKEVAYSYEMSAEEESTIIPCAGRFLPKNCYTIEAKFVQNTNLFFYKTLFYILIFSGLGLFIFSFYKRKAAPTLEKSSNVYNSLGIFKFYPEQNKLVKETDEISLSKKECELLEIFVASPNQIIKRDELMKKVWEDNGVFVGRSLDTYISKLRKKLQDDTSIKLTNVHGVGYKLEVN